MLFTYIIIIHMLCINFLYIIVIEWLWTLYIAVRNYEASSYIFFVAAASSKRREIKPSI